MSDQGQAPTDDNPGDDEQEEPQDGRLSLEAMESELRRARSEAARFRTEKNRLDSEMKSFRETGGKDLQLLTQERDTLREENSRMKSELRNERTKSVISAKAAELGFRNPGLAHRLVSLEDHDYDENGTPLGIATKLKTILRENPYLANTNGGGDGGQGQGTGIPGKESMSDLIRQATGRF